MKEFTHGSLFAGIGGFDLGFERAGFKTVWQVEIDPFCRKVLEKNFPHAQRFGDVRSVGRCELAAVSVISGGFPCQDVSQAGNRVGIDGSRSGLWKEMRRIICELRPQFVIVENVPGLLNRGIERVLGDLAESGFDAEWDVLPACSFGAPHIRERVWILAYPVHEGPSSERHMGKTWPTGTGTTRPSSERPEDVAYPQSVSRQVWESAAERPGRLTSSGAELADSDIHPAKWITESRTERNPWLVEPNVGRVAHGIPARVDRLKGLGNAVVPQIAEWIAHRIKAVLETE